MVSLMNENKCYIHIIRHEFTTQFEESTELNLFITIYFNFNIDNFLRAR